MPRFPRVLLAAAALLTAAAGAEQTFELRGRVESAPRRAYVSIFGAETPYTADAFSDAKGRFQFRKLAPGAYTVSVLVPGRGEVRRTVEVSKSLADSKGRVSVTIPFSPPSGSAAETMEDRHTVSVRRLSIPERARRQYIEAQKDLGKSDVASAVEHLKRAVETAPQFAAAWNNLGTIAYQTQKYQEAEHCFRKALEQEPGAFEPVVNLGGVLLNLGRYEEALKYNRYAAGDEPHDALANAQLGMSYFYLGNDGEALKYLGTAKRLDPSHFSFPQLLLARIYLRRSDRKAAAEELEDFTRRHPDAPEAEKARKEIKRLREQPSPPSARKHN